MLRTHKLGEADRIVTVLTRENGRMRGVAKGVRRTSSKFGARLEPFMHVDLQFWHGRTLDVITQADTVVPYARSIIGNYPRYTAASAMVETVERLTPDEREPATQQFLLLVGALRTLARGDHESGLVLDAFLLRSLATAGWAPSFDDCARCGGPGPHRAFSVQSGGVVCPLCRPPGSTAPAPDTLTLLGALLSGDWAHADGSEHVHRAEASSLVTAFLEWHVERGVRALRMVERADPTPERRHPQGHSGPARDRSPGLVTRA